MQRIYKLSGAKPPLGYPLAGNNLQIGLKIASLLNEDGTGGPWIGTGSPVTKILNLTGRQHGAGAATLGGTAPQHNWGPSVNRGSGFINQSSGSGGAIDYGPTSNFGSFSAFSVVVLCGEPQGGGGFSQWMVLLYDGTDNFDLGYLSPDFTNIQSRILTAGGLKQLVIGAAPNSSNPSYMNLFAVTYDGTTAKGYINGILKASSAMNSALAWAGTPHVEFSGSTVVNNANNVTPYGFFGLWNRVLTAAEIQQIYLDPRWVMTIKPRVWRSGTPAPVPPPVPTPSGAPNIPLIGAYATTRSGFGINQKVIAIPEMSSFDEVRQVLAHTIRELQNHIATQLPIVDYKQRKITNVAPPTEGDDVVTLKYLQSVQLPAQPKSS
jgi:hypothetical protein